jgi:hypothetical protein
VVRAVAAGDRRFDAVGVLQTATHTTRRAPIARRPAHRRAPQATETFEDCLRLLAEAIARAERTVAEMDRELSDLDRRTAHAVGRMRPR